MRNRLIIIAAAATALVLAGCNTESALQPRDGIAGQQLGSSPQDAGALVVESSARIRVAPIVGTTVEAATPLSRRLTMRAGERGLTLVPNTENNYTHVLKGYFSAFSENGKTTVVYVWDVLDPSGNRLHRIQGQEAVAVDGGSDAWAAVPPEAMERIADRSVDSLALWIVGAAG